jgi:hypothetical protein
LINSVKQLSQMAAWRAKEGSEGQKGERRMGLISKALDWLVGGALERLAAAMGDADE